MTIAVMLLTKNRTEYAERTLHSALYHLQTTESLRLHIADDGSEPGHVEHLRKVAFDIPALDEVTWSETGGHSYGRSFNMATQIIHEYADIILVLEDDWELTRDIDLDTYARVLRGGHGINCIRFGYIGFTQDLWGRFVKAEGFTGILLDDRSPEHHVFAGHPRLETRDWERAIGPWPEGLNAGTTEFEVAENPKAREGVVWPIDLGPFHHIGTIQARTDQGPPPA